SPDFALPDKIIREEARDGTLVGRLQCSRVEHGTKRIKGFYKEHCLTCKLDITLCMDCSELCHRGHAMGHTQTSERGAMYTCTCGSKPGAPPCRGGGQAFNKPRRKKGCVAGKICHA